MGRKKGYGNTARMREHRDGRGTGGRTAAPERKAAPDAPPDDLLRCKDAYLERLAVRHFSPRTLMSAGVSLRWFTHWCEERSLASVASITRPILESYQRHLWQHRKTDGKPLGISTQHYCQRSLQNAPPVVTSKCTTFDGCFSRFFGFVLARGFSVPLRGGVRGTVVPCLVV